jgi:hypothetical protein
MRFSHIAHPGSLTNLVRGIIHDGQTGKLFEYYVKDKLVGVGAVAKEESKNAEFVADVTIAGLDQAAAVIAKIAKAASRWKIHHVWTRIPKGFLPYYMEVAKWKTETARDIPVTRLI